MTALHLAAQKGKVDVVRILTEAKAHVNIQTEVQCTVYTVHTHCIDLECDCLTCSPFHCSRIYF